VVCQTAHPRDFFGERDCAACRWTDNFIDVKQSTPDQDSSTARGPKQESVVRQVPGDQRTVARARGIGKSVKLSRRQRVLALQAAVAGKQIENGNVRGFVRKWRPDELRRTPAPRCVRLGAQGLFPAGGPKSPGFPCFSRKSRYIPRHLTRKHGSKGRPVAAGPQGSFAHTFPEEPTGELNDGASRIFYASAA
jgi:hypothetical protein